MTQRNGTCIVRWCSACIRCRYEFCAVPLPHGATAPSGPWLPHYQGFMFMLSETHQT